MKQIGFRIKKDFERLEKDVIQSFENIPVANIADNMNRSFCIGSSILKPLNKSPLLGTAFTVKARPGDNLILNKAIDMAKPGDIIVVEGQGNFNNALIGELMIKWAKKRGVAGFVIDGAVRDYQYISQDNTPVYATHITPAGPYKHGPGEINYPISIQGVVVNPGDLIVGDMDGLVIINKNDAKDILNAAQNTLLKEQIVLTKIQNGTWEREWVDEMLDEMSCEYVSTPIR